MVWVLVNLLEESACDVGEVADGCGNRVGGGSGWLGEGSPARAKNMVVQRVVEASYLPTLEGDHVAVGACAELERENHELRRANEILKAAAGFFARELDPRLPKS